MSLCLAQNAATSATSNLFADILKAPAVQRLAQRLENGGVLTCAGVSQAAQPFFAVLLQIFSPQRPIVIVTDNLKTQESFQQDIETWLDEVRGQKCEVRTEQPPTSHLSPRPFFYPAWDVLPHEGKLPHADTISDRLETLVALSLDATRNTQHAPLVVTSVTALLQKTFPPGEIQKRTRTLARGDKINPLDLIEWLEERSYEPEAQVTQKGEIALRGGILDVWPLTSPWPVRLEFFGDELESLRHFDPLTQISREEILSVTLPPAGELGILKKMQNAECRMQTLNPQPSTRSLVWPPCPTICHRRQFFSSANRNNSPPAPTNTRSKSPKTIHFSFLGLISAPNSTGKP